MSADDTDAAADDPTGSSAAPDASGTPKIRIENVSKRFGRILALDDVSIDVRDNEIYALIGDNGAGKSTLMNIVSGVHEPSSGQVYLDGRPINFSNHSDARKAGIETVYQDLALMNDLDIASNIFMGSFPTKRYGPLSVIDWDETYRRAEEIMHDALGRDVDVRTEVEFFSGGQRQLVAVGRSLAFDPEVIVLDEPTSALSIDATRLVHETIRRLRDQGMTIVIVSHSIESVLELADRIGVLYQGRLVATLDPEETDIVEITELMTTGTREGAELDD
ncbi:ATP-binding cassette domain-containing protein [Halosimplex amylolyticum]|uniref:ATP-binding cassette domain-containing protein n=1 Tax=Halosimplex amylolyticum TaxID=3396616 RepID=UPI003F579480